MHRVERARDFRLSSVALSTRKFAETPTLFCQIAQPDSSLADLYDEVTMPLELRRAHQANDRAVMQAYGFDVKTMTESKCVSELMKTYQKLSRK